MKRPRRVEGKPPAAIRVEAAQEAEAQMWAEWLAARSYAESPDAFERPPAGRVLRSAGAGASSRT